jgi:hypothetical protein
MTINNYLISHPCATHRLLRTETTLLVQALLGLIKYKIFHSLQHHSRLYIMHCRLSINNRYTLRSSDSSVARIEDVKDKCAPSVHMKSAPIKSVSFNESVRMKRVRHISSYTKEEVEACWYDDFEMSAMIQSMKDEVKQLETRNRINMGARPSDLHTRGLEHRTASASKIRSQR